MQDDFDDEDTMIEDWRCPVRVFETPIYDELTRQAFDMLGKDSPIKAIELHASAVGLNFILGAMRGCHIEDGSSIRFQTYHNLPKSLRLEVANLAAILDGDGRLGQRLSNIAVGMDRPSPDTDEFDEIDVDFRILLFPDFALLFIPSSERVFDGQKEQGQEHLDPKLYGAILRHQQSNHATVAQAATMRSLMEKMADDLHVDLDENWVWRISPPTVEDLLDDPYMPSRDEEVGNMIAGNRAPFSD